MNNQRTGLLAAAVLAALAAPSARAIDVTAGAWTLSFDGNVNANYIYSNCADHNDVAGGLACVSDTTSDSSSAVSNGLLPAALTVSGATTQDGLRTSDSPSGSTRASAPMTAAARTFRTSRTRTSGTPLSAPPASTFARSS